MVPHRLLRRLVLAPIVIVIGLGVIVLSPVRAVLALLFGLAGLARAGQPKHQNQHLACQPCNHITIVTNQTATNKKQQ